MLKNGIKKKSFGAGVLVILIIGAIISGLHIQLGSAEEQNPNEILLSFYFTEPWITQVNISNITYDKVIINGSQSFGQNGTPCLPVKPVNVLLPQDGVLQSIAVCFEGNMSLGEDYNVLLGKNQKQLDDEEEQNQTNQSYNSSRPYPTTTYSNCGVYYFRGYSILIFILHPVYYNGSSGEIYYYKWMNVTITTSSTGSVNSLFRNLPEDEKQMKQMVDDYSRSNTYISDSDYPPPSLMVDPTKMSQYVIITTASLAQSPGVYTFQDLCDYKNDRGIKTTIVTVDDIYEYYVGSNPQEKIRNFIRDAYRYWDTNYVLLGGDNNDAGYGTVLAKYLWVDTNVGGLQGEMDNIPSDLYYSCLDGSFNSDTDSYYGEPNDGSDIEGGNGDVDMIAEVYVGRACVDNPTEVSNFVMKTLAYENTVDPYLENVLMVGEHLWGPPYDPDTWGGDYKDQIIDGSDYDDYLTVGIPSDEYTIDKLYDRDWLGHNWPKSEIINRMETGQHIINHLGHSGYDHNMKLFISDVDLLENEKYCFIYSQGCMAGGFDNPEGYDCVAEHFTVKTQYGAFAGIWNARFGFDVPGGTDGASQRYDRWFFDGIYDASLENSVMRELGAANQYSKEKNLHHVNEIGVVPPEEKQKCRRMRWVYYELNLFGDPEIAIKSDHDLEVTSIDLPKYVTPDTPIPVKAYIWNRGLNDETDVTVNFIVDGEIQDSDTIDVARGDAEEVSFTYNFSHGTSYDISVEMEIVDGEEITSNNRLDRNVIGDHPPGKPTAPDGPLKVKKNEPAIFTTSTTDSDNDQVYYWWDWGDGTPGSWGEAYDSGQTVQKIHTWQTKNDYYIRVIAKDEYGALSVWSDPMHITVPLELDISIQQTTVLLGQEAMFFSNLYDAVTPCDFLWMLGDSSVSYNQNATHIYYNPGKYVVTLNVTDNESDCGTATINITIVPVIADFTTNPAEYAQTSKVVSFSDNSEGYYTIVNWTWNFDDGSISYNQNPTHTYHRDGVYNVSLTIRDNQSNNDMSYQTLLIDSLAPEITMISATPHMVGFGSNVTITANVTDPPGSNNSGLNTICVNITYPDATYTNCTMNRTDNNTYRFLFSYTWHTGQYNFTIWAVDNSTNSNSSSGHHFHVSATATISIATLKNSYSGNQYINITDPPNPPEDYTLIGQGLTWDKYYNAITGQNILEVSTEPINYQEDGVWNPINTTLSQLDSNHPGYVYGYRAGNDHGLYGAYFKSNAQSEWPVAFTYNKSDDPTIHAIRSKLVGVGYVDPQNNWAYQYLQNVQSSPGQLNGDSITYSDIFTGTDVTWSYGNTGLKEEITLSNATKTVLQNHPPSQYGLNDASSYLVFITKLDYQNLNLYNGSRILNGNVTVSDMGIDIKDVLGQFKCALPLGEAYELNNETARQKLTYRIIHLNGNTYLLSGLKVADLNAMTFPVVVDPTLTVYSTSSDGHIYNSGTNYNTVQSASSGTVDSSGTYITIGQKKISFPGTYYIYRGFVFFNTSTLPSNAYIDNATLSIYKKDDYSTTDFDITIQNGQPTYPHNPMQTGDYFRNYYSGNGGTLGTSRFTSGYNAITMSNFSWINKTGITKLCLRSSRDISGTAPTGNEYVNVYTNEFLGMNPPRLVINYRNQSKIKNNGSTDIKGYLLIQVQFYNTSQAKWVLDNDTINETTTRTITSGNQLALDTIFNGLVRASDLTHGTGTYRVYTTFRDSDGNILRTNDDVDLEAWWQFSKT